MNSYDQNPHRTGLVMEGGAMRGMFTAGVIDVFMENGIEFDGGIGVSAGATFGCNIKSRQIGRPLRYNKKYCGDPRYGSYLNWLKTGNIFDTEYCYKTVPLELDPWDAATFEKNPMEFYSVATDASTGKAMYHHYTDGGELDIRWIQASASIPVFSQPVEINGREYLDGGTSDSIPLRFLEHKGYEKIVVVETQPKDYRKKPQKFMRFIRFYLKDYPNMIKALENRHRMYNAEKRYVQQKEASGEILVIRPEAPLNIKSTTKDPSELERVYQEGRRMATAKLEEVRRFLA